MPQNVTGVDVATKGLTKQAKTFNESQIEATLALLSKGKRRPQRDAVAFLLSVRAGLRAKEVAAVTWAMVTDGDGRIAGELRLTNGASGRVVGLHKHLKAALVALHDAAKPTASEPIVGGTAGAMRVWFLRL
jgi:integrase